MPLVTVTLAAGALTAREDLATQAPVLTGDPARRAAGS